MKLLEKSGHGLTTLPKDPDVIKKRIRQSDRSFNHREEGPAGEDYLFIMVSGRSTGPDNSDDSASCRFKIQA